ncbi:methyl-CpG-binding domain-containing protein 5-like isoform X1 [Pistacia vera]|uniref:methyl-CpG-binding domain-containing protein 5-like isoform X1 n=1 Tax=Pistacia vera TaxID=55513 RepID=UPI00126313E6|nr:methyl-CpG-binding domain-containing protein 5-like isoform X1 [Pistacia vera]
MSTSTPPPLPHDPNLKSQQPDPPVPLSSSADFPPDPLLKSGSFITANSPTPTPTANPPTTTTTATATAASTTTSAHTQNKKSPNQATSNGSESQSTPSKRRPPTAPPPETPEWLPPGWLVEDRVRSSGATAGLIDRYYFDPSSARRFRSKKEVLYFLETGTPRKRKKGAENSNADVDKSGTKGKTVPAPTPTPMPAPAPAPSNFDYCNAPEKIQWVLTKTSEDTWTPFIGKDKVPENTKREWAVAFTFLSTSNGGNKMS